MRRGYLVAAVVTAALALAGCSGEELTYEKKRDYLRKVAIRGAETHSLIAASEGNPDKGRCEKAEDALNDDAPEEVVIADDKQWQAQVRAFFVDSCVSGKPKELPPLGVPVSPSQVAPVPLSPSASPVPAAPSAVPSVTP